MNEIEDLICEELGREPTQEEVERVVMELPEFVSRKEVRRILKSQGIVGENKKEEVR